MKNRFIYILFISLGFWSCNDFLDVEPDLQVSLNEQLSTKEGVLQAYNGIYRDIESLMSSNYILYADALGGNIAYTPNSTNGIVMEFNQMSEAYNFRSTETELEFLDSYLLSYEIINQTNILLERLNTFSFFTSEELQQLEAELLSVRAMAHYQVSLMFAQNYNFTSDASHLGVVYNTSTIAIGEDFPARNTMAETYNLINDDLNSALDLYTDLQLLSGPSYSYFNMQTTKALYARIALQMNDWEIARDFSNDVINTSGITLTATEDYVSQWEQEVLPINEIVMEFTAPLDGDGTIVSSSITQYYSIVQTSNVAKHSASGDLLALYSEDDIRGEMFIVQDLNTNENGVISPKPYYFTKKFQDQAGTTFIRLSELYLIRAEANARLNNLDLALADLNILRTRANNNTLDTTNNILEEIFLERRRELAFENHLLFDIIRYKKDVIRNEDCIATVCNLAYPSDFLIQPIPFFSISLNQNIEQNEGY